MRRAILSAVVLIIALMAQLTVVNRLPLPGGGAPDLVLLAVVALGLCARPATAAVTGFAAGLCLDIAPPGSYLIGEYALVFCLVGYLCGRLRGALNNMVLPTIAAAIAAAAAGEALFALLGKAVSDPQVSWAVVRLVLPSSIIYDVLVTPFVLYLVMRAVRWADSLGRDSAADSQADGSALLGRSLGAGGALPGSALPGATMLGGAGLLGGAGWLAGPVGSRGSRGPRRNRGGAVHTPRTPRLREAAARTGDGWLGGGPRPGLSAPAGIRAGRPPLAGRPGRPPRLRPGAGTPGSALARPPRALPRSTANLRFGAGRRGGANIGRALGTAGGPASLTGSALRARAGSGPPGSAFRGRRPASGRPAAARSGALARGVSSSGPRFRPQARMPGGSSSGAALHGGGMQRALPRARVNLRLGSARRHDGVVGGSVLGGGALRGGGLGGKAHRGAGIRPISLRLGSGRRGDGALGGLSGAASWARPRLGGQRRAAPRFRSGPAIGGHSLLAKRNRLRAGKRARFGSGRSSFLATWTGGRLGGRSTVWRIGSKRTGGFR